MIRFFVKRPITTIMFVLLWVVLGIAAFPNMNIERTPAVDFPMVTTTLIYPGASPAEIESQVITKTEDAISQVAGVKKITSQAFENGGFVMTEFNLGVNVNDKASEVKAKLDSIQSEFPDDLKQPVVEKLNPLQESVMDIALTGADVRDLEFYADDILSNKITAIKGVAGVTIFGGEKRAIRIMMNPELMAARGVSITDIVSALGAHNLNVPSGKLEQGTDSNNVRFIGEFKSIKDIENLRITTGEGQNFLLREIATVKDSARDIETGARLDGKPVVILSVVKASDGNAIKISKALRTVLPKIEQEMQLKFANSHMDIISDSSIAIEQETNNTLRNIWLGLALTIIILLVFTRNWRTTIIAGIMIPTSLIAGIFFMDISGFTINAMTLLAIATALGTLITDAIILIESALGLIEQGMSPEDAAVEGTKRVAVRIFATILTHVVVFLPLVFMDGIVGQFMKQFGLSVVYLVLLSSVFSFTLTPMMIAKILRARQNKKDKLKKQEKSLQWYRPFYNWQISHPWRAVGVALIIFILSIIPMIWVGNEFQPSVDIDEIKIIARAPANSSFIQSEQIAKQLEEKLSQFSEIKSVSVKIGERGVQNIKMRVELIPRSERNISDKLIAQKILPKLSEVPDVEIQVRAGISSDSVVADMVLNISGDDDIKREAYTDQVIQALNQIPEIQSVVRAQQSPGDEIRFIPDNEKMSFWGIKNATAGIALRTALFGNDNYKFKEAGKEYPIILEFAKPFKTNEMFDSVFISSYKGLVPLSELGKIEQAKSTPEVRRLNKNRITEININLGKSTIGPVQKKIETELKKIDWESGYNATFGGISEIQSETTNEISIAFLLATILTFMSLAAILNSLAHPFTIATGILTSFSGVFILMFLTGATINVASMLALIMLVGLAVSNNILILEPTLTEMERGTPATKALWEQFVDKKRMLVMTTIAVVAGLVPQLWSADGMKRSMGAVIIGGILASLFWTFFLTPAIFMLMEKTRKKKYVKKTKSSDI